MKLFLDCEPELQPDSTYRYALNKVDDSSTGAQGASVSEQANQIAITIDGKLLGSKTIARYKHVLFTNNNEILLYNSQDNTVESLIQFDAFNFGDKIKVEHRVVRGCEDVIYFYDGINPDRQFNISRPELYRNNGDWDINLFNINPDSTFVTIETEALPSGGLLELGRYYFAVKVVDENENEVYISQVQGDVTITDDDDGGLNMPVNLPEIGGIPKTNKCIKVKITNIQDYPFVKLIVFRSITGDGLTADVVQIGQLIPVNNGVADFIYSGFDNTRDTFIDAREIVVNKARYQTSKTFTQVDNRLLRANLIESVRDYKNYQKFASMIASNYALEYVSKDEKEVITELGGEVKAYAICYVHKDGTISPPFHIPGSAKLPSDEVPITIDFDAFNGTDLSINIECFHTEVIVNGEMMSRFDLTYTFSDDITSATLFFPNSGIPYTLQNTGSIFHITEFYPVPPYSIPIIINIEYNTNIYRFENDVRCDLANVNYDYPIQPVASTSIVPIWRVYSTAANGRFGYYQNNEFYNNPPNYCGDDYWGVDSEGVPLQGKPVRFHVMPDRSVVPLMEGDKLIKIGVNFSNIEYPNEDVVGHFFVSNIRTPDNSTIIAKGLQISFNQEDQGRYFNNVSGQQILPDTLNHFICNEGLFDKRMITGQYTMSEGSFNISTLETDYNYNNYFDNELPYRDLSIYIKQQNVTNYNTVTRGTNAIINSYILPYRSEYRGIKNNSYSSNFNLLRLNFAPSSIPIYSTIKTFKNVFQSLFSINYRRIGGLNQNLIFNGDVFISKLDVTNVSWISVSRPFLAQNTIKYEYELIKNIYLESTINANYRHGGTGDCNDYWREDTVTTDFIIDKVIEVVDGKPRGRDSVCPEFYGYNKDFSFVNKFNTYYPLNYTYNYCSDCLGTYPNRIIFSKRSFEEDLEDNYRVFLANDYVDIPANTGEIVSMNYYNGKIVVRTTNSCFFLQPNPQQLQLSETTAYIGTGDFLSLPAQELNITDIGYAGQQDVLAEVITEHGMIWVDGLRGKVYRLTDKLDEISRIGLYHWFKENLKPEAVITYDPEFERILLTSNDFTISYSFRQNAWKSWHSYKPERYFYNGNTFFSVINNGIWKHQSNKNCVFYDTAYESVIEITMPNPMAYHLASIQYYAKAQIYNETTQQWEDSTNVTFDKGWVFNSNQSSGYFNILVPTSPYNSTVFNNRLKFVTLTDRMHKISGVYDLSTSTSIINKVNSYDIEPVNVDYDKPMYKLAHFRDKFLRVRLFFNKSNHRLVINMLDTLKVDYVR